jgi:hypothetical protein
MFKKLVEAVLYPFVYLERQRSLIRMQEQNSMFETISEMQSSQMETFQKLQESNTALMSEVVKTSAASSEVIKTWLEGFKSVEIPQSHEFNKPDDQLLEELKEEYRMENPNTFELAEMTQGLLDNFRFTQ